MKLTQTEMNKSLNIFIGWAVCGFAFGILISELVWITHGILFHDEIILHFVAWLYFGIIFAVISIIPAIIVVSGIINVKNRRIARLIFYVFLVIISLSSIYWGVMEYEEIFTYDEKIIEAYPWSIYIIYILVITGALYAMRGLYRRIKKQHDSEAELEFVFLALLVLFIAAGALLDIFL
jgi:uncharacterized membrane protein YtjA (UPF0391 family)